MPMCYSDDARPPLVPTILAVGGAATDHGHLHLTAADGNRLMAYFARAAQSTGAGVVIMPDVRGLHAFYQELAQRFTEAGIDAVAIDYFGRTAGDGPRDESFEYRPHVEQTTPQGINADVRAGVEYLRSAEGGGVSSVFTIGFCYGGAQSWRQSAGGHGLAGAIGLYGIPARVRDVIPEMKAPLLLLIAGDDFTPPEEFDRFQSELRQHKVAFWAKTYPGAPHSFFDRSFSEHVDACEDAWRQILLFIKEHSA
jgi:carboxymethylenebutenolidase